MLTSIIFSCDQPKKNIELETPKKINYTYKLVVDSLDIPWGLSFINKNDFLITEKLGFMYRVKNGKKYQIQGLPPVYVRGQGGLLDVAVSPKFNETNEIYFTVSTEVDSYNDFDIPSESQTFDNYMKNTLVQNGLNTIRKKYPFVFKETFRDFVETFGEELINKRDPIEKFQLFLDVNYYPDIKNQYDLRRIEQINKRINQILMSGEGESKSEKDKLKSELRDIQSRYSFIPQNGKRKKKGGHTALYMAKLVDFELKNLKMIYKGDYNTKKGQHWGSRIAFDNKGHIFFSIGDRGNRDVNPQNLSRDGGKIYRLNLDGSIPDDNPFLGLPESRKAIYSYGHRNPQGMVYNKNTNKIWTHEHGPMGGDEINIIKPGKNYGWPIITYGINYSGTIITDKTSMEGMEQPLYYWVPSIAPSGMAFSNSDIYPEWKNNLFVGSLKFQYVEMLSFNNKGEVIKRSKILEDIGRVRNVVEGPEGYLYVSVVGKGIFKISPKT